MPSPRTPKSTDLEAPGTGSDQDPQDGAPGGPITGNRVVPCSWQATARAPGANGLQPAGPLLSPINRAGRCDVPQDPLAPGFWSSGPAPSRYSHRGPGGQLRNVSTAGVSQRSQARRLGTADSGVKEAPAGLGRYDGIQPPFPRHALQLHKATIVEDDSGPGNQVFHRL
jgi:hypothetical protein